MTDDGAHEQGEPGVLGSLPRTRPQRPSRRRESAKASSDNPGTKPARRAAKASAKPRTTKTSPAKTAAAKTSSRKPAAAKRAAPKTPPPRRREPPAPKQGYEPMEEPKAGATVHPPSGVELVESVATIVAELASVGVKAGGRVLKDALSPLRKQ
ncbi:MAG: hypothetical protein ACTHM1_03920 [Solirubrobacteraceae bacterium]